MMAKTTVPNSKKWKTKGFGVFLALGMTLFVGCRTTGGRAVYDVRDFGAVGDGVTKDTVAIQAAIDAASSAGGGTVELTSGTYISGSIWLKSNVDFHLAAGAVLKGSGDIADYCAADCCPQNYASSPRSDNTTGGHLILCVGQHNVTMRGPGKVDGNSDAFLLDETGKRWGAENYERMRRPAQMIWFVDSTDIRITDLEIADAPYWSCFVLNCDRVWVRGCHIHTQRRRYHTYNGDGLDLDRCRWVEVSDCRIDTADDCITLRASGAKRLTDPHDCAFVTIANCNLSSSCNAIRPGVGEGIVHDVVISNITISDARTAFNFVAAYSKASRGPDIRDVRVANIRIDAKNFLKMHHMHSKEAAFANIVFDGVSGKVAERSIIRARKTKPFEKIVFRNVDLPCGFEALNADVRIEGGTLQRIALSEEEIARRNADMEAGRNRLY